MAPPVVGSGTLRRLRELDTSGHPVLSVYLDADSVDADSAGHPTAATGEGQLQALMARVGRGAGEASVNRVRDTLLSMGGLAYGARSLALFSSADGSVFETVPLPSHVEAMAVIDTLPWLEPLAAMLTSGDCGVAVIGRRSARMFRGSPRMLVEFAAVHDGHHRRQASGDWSQLGSQRPTEEHMVEHARHLSALLMRAHRRRAFDHLVVATPNELWPPIETALHSDLREQLAGLVALDLEHAPIREIVRAVAPVLQRAEDEKTECSRCSTITIRPIRGHRPAVHETTTRYMQRLAQAQSSPAASDRPMPPSRVPCETRMKGPACP